MLDFDKCWAAVESRDAGADSGFFYGVRTTGVYCRPGCPSRRPLRANTVFFETIAAAEAAGLRACKRCRPTDASTASRHVATIEKACALLRSSETMPSLAELADAAAVSRFHFHRVFKQITGATPRDYARTHRLGDFARRLDNGEKVTEAIYGAGFGSSSRAYDAAPAALGMTPAARRRGGGGETVRYVTVATPLGWALVAATARGVRLTALGDDRAHLAAMVRQRFPAAAVIDEDPGLKDWATRSCASSRHPARRPICRSTSAAPRPGAGVAGIAKDPARPHRDIQRSRAGARPAEGGARGGAGLRREQPGADRAVPPGDPRGWRSRRLSLGGGAQARLARTRAGSGGGR